MPISRFLPIAGNGSRIAGRVQRPHGPVQCPPPRSARCSFARKTGADAGLRIGAESLYPRLFVAPHACPIKRSLYDSAEDRQWPRVATNPRGILRFHREALVRCEGKVDSKSGESRIVAIKVEREVSMMKLYIRDIDF